MVATSEIRKTDIEMIAVLKDMDQAIAKRLPERIFFYLAMLIFSVSLRLTKVPEGKFLKS